ncbi:hypothetical protein MKK60_00395, partial [Methylobacterium sp. J-092]|nr:hypothetical protein [Methylobacterium sp. J-092]
MAATAPKSMTDVAPLQAPFRSDAAIPFPARQQASSNPLILKLEHACVLDETDRAALWALSTT